MLPLPISSFLKRSARLFLRGALSLARRLARVFPFSSIPLYLSHSRSLAHMRSPIHLPFPTLPFGFSAVTTFFLPSLLCCPILARTSRLVRSLSHPLSLSSSPPPTLVPRRSNQRSRTANYPFPCFLLWGEPLVPMRDAPLLVALTRRPLTPFHHRARAT